MNYVCVYLFLRFKDRHEIRQINPSQTLMILQYVITPILSINKQQQTYCIQYGPHPYTLYQFMKTNVSSFFLLLHCDHLFFTFTSFFFIIKMFFPRKLLQHGVGTNYIQQMTRDNVKTVYVLIEAQCTSARAWVPY